MRFIFHFQRCRRFELLNYGPVGTTVDSVLYGGGVVNRRNTHASSDDDIEQEVRQLVAFAPSSSSSDTHNPPLGMGEEERVVLAQVYPWRHILL